MTYQIFKKNGTWYKSYTELGDGKYDEQLFVELPDSMNDVAGRCDLSLEEILNYAEHSRGFVGMHGLKTHFDLPESTPIKSTPDYTESNLVEI